MNQKKLLEIAAFSPRSLQAPNAWVGHLPFAAWLIQEVSPKLFVELGTHSGNSYFTFCQSVLENDLSTQCYAVDTWSGDEHSGHYGDDIFDQVNAHQQQYYAGFSHLLRMTFDEAVKQFADQSIELLHIDGFHTYKAVRHDFETWLPKLAPGAVVIFHDVKIIESDFGVFKVWEELQNSYPNNLMFEHSCGLGVLQLDNAPDNKKIQWLRPDFPERSQLINYFVALGTRQIEKFEFNRLEQYSATLIKKLSIRDEQIENRDKQIENSGRKIERLERRIAVRDQQIANRNLAAADRDGRIATLNLTVINCNSQIESLSNVLDDRDAQIIKLNEAKNERDSLIADLNLTLADRDKTIDALNHGIVERDEQIAVINHAVAGYAEALKTIEEIRSSTSWRVTGPIRFTASKARNMVNVLKLLPRIIRFGGGAKASLKKSLRVFSREGLSGVKQRILFVAVHRGETQGSMVRPDITSAAVDRNDYTEWVRRYDTLAEKDRQKIKSKIAGLETKPLISVLMPVYNPPVKFLEQAILSVCNQLYPNWELCIADDASTDPKVRKLLKRYMANDKRIRVVFREKNGHISAASNSALDLVAGEYVALLDHDDQLREHALFWVADAIVNNPDVGLIYSDEDKIDESGLRFDPYFKPDWNPDLFLSHNMICHLGAYRTDLVRKLGGFRKGFEGSQDYDLALRFIEQLATDQIVHIPRVLYHWRSHPGSTAQAASEKHYALLAGERALNDHFARTKRSAKAELLDFDMYRVRYEVPAEEPLVSLIIPTRNNLSLIQQCVESILSKTTYKNYEILIVDNNSDDSETLSYFANLVKDNRIRVLRDERPFNFSALNNAAVEVARGDYIGLINNDIEVISPEWLNEMMGFAIQPGVGAVGARLWYPNNTLQHGGVITGLGVAGHAHKHLKKDAPGYFNRARLIQTMSVVTAACLVIKKSVYKEVHGMDETHLKVAFNDVDFCLRVREAGYRNIWTPYAELYHHESASRGYEDTPEKQLRFKGEILYMKKRWGASLKNDPAYNPNLTHEREDFSFAWPPRIRL